jgi:hypothetical protein
MILSTCYFVAAAYDIFSTFTATIALLPPAT